MNDNLENNFRMFQQNMEKINDKTSEEYKRVKIARLMVIMLRIERELKTMKGTLIKLRNHAEKFNPKLLPEVDQKIFQVDNLTLKISKARLTLNITYL